MSDAFWVELIRDVCVLLGGVAATMGVAWISSRGPKKILEKVEEVHKLTNDASEKALAKIDALTAEVQELKNAASWKAGFSAGQADGNQTT